MLKKLSFSLSTSPFSNSGEIWIGAGAMDLAGVSLNPKNHPGKAIIIADRRLRKQAQQLSSFLKMEGWIVHTLFVTANEAFKSFERVYPLYGQLLKWRADRQTVLFAVGGGVIGDAVGFVAGTYLRGIRWVGVPTTLLAQVDSAVGGKTGVNHPVGKNLIGVFHQPVRVICDPHVLVTLPRRELISGLGEVVKYGLIFDEKFFNKLIRNWNEILECRPKALGWAIETCLRWKNQIVQKDPYETQGVRELLNFGHTVAHAVEAETGYRFFRHGEAVILGMRVAGHLSVMRGYLEAKTQRKIEAFLSSLPVPQIPSRIKTQKLVERMRWDKKVKDGKGRFVLLKRIGEAVLDSQVQETELKEAIEKVRSSDG